MREAVKYLRYMALPVAAVALLTGAEWLTGDAAEAPVNAAAWDRSGYGPADYAAALARTEDAIALGRERVARQPDQWLAHETLARGHMRRARLSHSYDDLAAAGTVLTEARAMAPTGAGPVLSDAVVGQMSHQLDRVEQALTAIDGWAVKSEPAVLAEAAGLKGDIAFYRGDMRGAEANYAAGRRYGANAGLAYREAILAKSRGQFDEAIAHFASATPEPHRATPFANASSAMQIGAVELARGNRAAARLWFATADRLFPGFWLIEAHLAQAKALDGDLDGAIADMTRIARRAPSAEVMDALAMLLRQAGRADESRQWAKRAAAIWDRRLVQLPEAAYGHAVEHELVFGSPRRALDLARKNLAARPYGESRILLASALLSNGDTGQALDQLARAEASGWRSAALYALRAQALELAGRTAEAGAARDMALSYNPHILDPETSLIWFSHG